MSCHAAYLENASEVLANALNCTTASSDTAAGKILQLPLPGVTKQQIQVFLCTIYSLRADRFVSGLSFALLRDLADIAHKYACHEVLHMADTALVELSQRCGRHPAPPAGITFGNRIVSSSFMTPANALGLYGWAGRIQLKAFREEAAGFLVSRAHDLDFTAKDTDQSLMLLQQVSKVYNRCT